MTLNSHLLRRLTALSLLAPLTSFASTDAFTNGFYVGVKMGGQQTMVSQDHSSSIAVTATENNQPRVNDAESFFFHAPEQDARLFDTGVLGNLGVGYAKIIEKFFIAAELSVNLAAEQELDWQSDTVSSSFASTAVMLYEENINTEVTFENPEIAFDLRPGLLLAKNFLLYGRIGVAYNQLSIEQEGLIMADNGSFYGSSASYIPVSSSDSEDIFALRVGLGVERKFTSNLSINLDYVFTDYGSIDTEFNKTSSSIDQDAGSTNTISSTVISSADVRKSIVTLGFNWYFGDK